MQRIEFGFWKEVHERTAGESRPIVVLAPMADVTDAAFRQIIAKYSSDGPDVMWTEFVSADGLCSPGREKLLLDLEYSEGERPIVAQLFSAHPEKMREAAALAASLGFDGIDINMGCPDRSIEKQGAGASLIKNPDLAKYIIEAARQGVREACEQTGKAAIPVSVKTRIGYNAIDIEGWIGFLLAQQLPVLTVHLRTRKEMSDVPAHWDHMERIVNLRDELQKEIPQNERTIILGNGDVADCADAYKKVKESGANGAMLGRAIFGNPWLFKKLPSSGNVKADESKKDISISERLNVMVEHTMLFEKLLGKAKNFAIMKKHYKAYVNGWDGAKELRAKLMDANSGTEVKVIVESYLASRDTR